jgi:two-component system cell cycle sensor histidine kinase PleC
MNRKPPLVFETALPEAVRTTLGDIRGAAWVVDLEKGRIAAATAQGARRLGLSLEMTESAGRRAVAEAEIAKLRKIAHERSAPPSGGTLEAEQLTFRTAAGPLPLSCEFSIPLQDAATPYVVVRQRGKSSGTKSYGMTRAEPAKAQPIGNGVRSLSSELAHELRTPLGAIAAAAEIMMDERFGPVGDKRYAAYVAGIHESALHAIRIVERALAEKPLMQSAAVEPGEVDVNAILENVALQVRPLAESAGLELALDMAEDLPHVTADPTSLRQIVINLLTNALKFTQAGGRVSVSSAVARDGTLVISVEDSGSGMSRDEIAEIMQHGDAPSPKRRAGGGLGLGLPLVRALAEANGASLLLESEPGRGTRAKIVFTGTRIRSG